MADTQARDQLDLDGIKFRAAQGILLNGVEDRRALLAEVERLQAQLAAVRELADRWAYAAHLDEEAAANPGLSNAAATRRNAQAAQGNAHVVALLGLLDG